MSKKKWRHANVKTEIHGTMLCTLCGKSIVEGDYRFREREDAYYAHQHTECLPIDQQNYWLDKEFKESFHKENLNVYLKACIEFKKSWDTNALDEEIQELEEYLK